MRKQCVTDTQSARQSKQFGLLREKDPIDDKIKVIFTFENTTLRTVFKQKKIQSCKELVQIY